MNETTKNKDRPDHPILTISELPQNKAFAFSHRWNDADLEHVATELNLRSLKKLSIEGTIQAYGRVNWKLSAKVGGSVVQSCVVSMEDVKTRVDEEIERTFLSNFETYEAENTTEEELDAEIEPIPEEISLLTLALETLALTIDDYPRKPGIELETVLVAPEGVTPLTDEAVKPFASLAALKDKLEK